MSKEIGTLVVVVLKARNLRDKHTIHKQDAFAQATLNGDTKKTKVDVRGGQHPVWDEELRFSIVKDVSDQTRKLEVTCWSKEPRSDDLVGRGSIDISETLKTGEFDDWVPLQTEEGQYRGDIFLEMTYYSAAPPPQRRPSKWISADRLKRPATTYSHGPSYSEAISKPSGNKTPSPNNQALAAVLKDDTLPPLPEEPRTPTSAPSIPASLRPGGGAPARTSPKSNVGRLPPEPSVRPLSSYPPSRDPSPPAHIHHSPHPSLDSVPPYLRPGGPTANALNPPPQSYTPKIPEPRIPAPEIPAPYGSPPRPYTSPSPRPYPTHPLPQSAPLPPQPTPHPQSTPYPAPRYGSPPREYTITPAHAPPPAPYGAAPPMPDYSPFGGAAPPPFISPLVQIPPHPHIHIPPHPQPQPYATSPYGGGPVYNNSTITNGWDWDRDHDPRPALPDPYLQARYQSPLPLPDGARAPTPSHPFPQPQPPAQAQAQAAPPPPHPEPQIPSPAQPPQPPPQTTRPPASAGTGTTGPTREARDRELALQFEKQEEERQRTLREQEERDMELARQLDLELNLEGENGRGARATAPSSNSAAAAAEGSPPPFPGRATISATGSGMPGSW